MFLNISASVPEGLSNDGIDDDLRHNSQTCTLICPFTYYKHTHEFVLFTCMSYNGIYQVNITLQVTFFMDDKTFHAFTVVLCYFYKYCIYTFQTQQAVCGLYNNRLCPGVRHNISFPTEILALPQMSQKSFAYQIHFIRRPGGPQVGPTNLAIWGRIPSGLPRWLRTLAAVVASGPFY